MGTFNWRTAWSHCGRQLGVWYQNTETTNSIYIGRQVASTVMVVMDYSPFLEMYISTSVKHKIHHFLVTIMSDIFYN